MTLYNYTEGNQIRGYIAQFMRAFSGYQYKRNSQGDLGQIPVIYGGMDRVVASIMTKRDHLQNGKLPLIAVNMTSLDIDTINRRDPRHVDNIINRVTGATVNKRLIGPAFNMNMEVSIYASSTSELFQILEQILLVFNPRITINVSSYAETGDYLTEIELVGLQDEIQKPLGTEKDVVQYSLAFTTPIRLRYPMGSNDGIIEKINARIIVDEDEFEFEIDGRKE